jgi:hypothetical protein
MADTQVVDLVHLGSFHFPFSSHFGRGLAEIVFTILLLADFLSFAFSLSSTYRVMLDLSIPITLPLLFHTSLPLPTSFPFCVLLFYSLVDHVVFSYFYLFTDYRELWITVMN